MYNSYYNNVSLNMCEYRIVREPAIVRRRALFGHRGFQGGSRFS